MNKDNQGNGMNTVRPHTEDEIYDILKQALDAMRLHTAETHPLVETERAMEAVEAKLAQPAQEPIRREQQLFMDEQAFYAAGQQSMRPAELAERLKQGEKWAVGQEQPAQQESVAIVVTTEYEDGSLAEHRLEWRGRNEANDYPDGTEFYTPPPAQRQPLATDEYVQALGPLLSQIVCSSGTLRCIVRTIEALHGIKEQP